MSFNRIIKLFNEFIGLPVALLIYFVTPSILRIFDPAAGEFDSGQLAVIAFGVIKLIVSSLVAWLGFRLNFPKLYTYFIDTMEGDFLENAHQEKPKPYLVGAIASLVIYFVYMALTMWAIQTV